MKKIIFLSSLILLLIASGSLAALIGDYINYQAPAGNYYQSDFDILVMDFVIPDNGGAEDSLTALTVKNKGTAQLQIEKVKIYVDDGPQGFQGMGIDKNLGYAVWYPNKSYWYLNNINENIPVGGLRVFVTVETVSVLRANYTLEFYVPDLDDVDSDGAFDLADEGIFVKSDNDGPVGDNIVNAYVQNIGKLSYDNVPPVAVIDNLKDGQTLDLSASKDFLITGLAKDRVDAYVAWVNISIDGGEWVEAKSTGYYFDTWQYLWQDITPGEHVIAVQTADFTGNKSTPTEITIEAKEVDISLTLIESEKDSVAVGEKAKLDVWLQDEVGNPIVGKTVTLHSSKKDYDTIEVINDVTDENGLATFFATSNLFGTSLYFAEVDEKLLTWNVFNVDIPISAVVEYVSDRNLSGKLIKTAEFSTVYLLGADNKRHVFPNEKIYYSWYSDFSNIETISAAQMANYELSSNIKYKPGSLIKMPSVPKVYLVDDDQNLRWIETEKVAKILFSSVWAGKVDDMSEAFFSDYSESQSIAETRLNISPFQSLLNQ